MTNVLAITSNPESDSMTNAVARAFLDGARAAGAANDVLDLLDLYEIGFNPVYGQADRRHYLGEAPMPADLVPVQRRLEHADVIALVFPIYWYTMPAMMKGFFDRVICRGFAYDAADSHPLALADKTVRVIALAGGSQDWYVSSGLDAALRNQICAQSLGKYCGVRDADLTYVGGLSMGNGDPERRQAASRQLDAIRTMGAELIRGRVESNAD